MRQKLFGCSFLLLAAAGVFYAYQNKELERLVLDDPSSETKSNLCHKGFRLERHDQEPGRGDLCRSRASRDFNCPLGCVGTGAGAVGCASLTSQSTPCRVARKIAVVLRTWSEDCELGMQTLSSLIHVLPLQQHLFEIVVVTDEASEQKVRQALASAGSSGILHPWNERTVKLVVEENFMHDGHTQQKYSKMTADLHTDAEYILHTDSDVFYSRWDDLCFFGKDNRPRLDYNNWTNLPNNVRSWKRGSEVLLNVSDVAYEFSRSNQHVYPRQLYSLLRDRIEAVAGRTLREVFQHYPLVGKGKPLKGHPNSLVVSDFNLLGAMAHYFKPDLMYENDLSRQSHDKVVSCTHQCNLRTQEPQCCLAWMAAVQAWQARDGATQGKGRGRFECKEHFPKRATMKECFTGALSSCNEKFLR